jgi:hypothetical protein
MYTLKKKMVKAANTTKMSRFSSFKNISRLEQVYKKAYFNLKKTSSIFGLNKVEK